MTSLETLDRSCRKIILKDFCVNMFLGITPYEKEHQQPVLINVSAWVEYEKDEASLYDYRLLIDVVREATKSPVLLQETLVDSIASALLKDPRVKAVRVASGKPAVYKEAALIGVEIFREQP